MNSKEINEFYQNFLKDNKLTRPKSIEKLMNEDNTFKDEIKRINIKSYSRGNKLVIYINDNTKPNLFTYKSKNENEEKEKKIDYKQKYEELEKKYNVLLEQSKKKSSDDDNDNTDNSIIEAKTDHNEVVQELEIKVQKSRKDKMSINKGQFIEPNVEPKVKSIKTDLTDGKVDYRKINIETQINYIRGFYNMDNTLYKSYKLTKLSKPHLQNLCTFQKISLDIGKVNYNSFIENKNKFTQSINNNDTTDMMKYYKILRNITPMYIGKFCDKLSLNKNIIEMFNLIKGNVDNQKNIEEKMLKTQKLIEDDKEEVLDEKELEKLELEELYKISLLTDEQDNENRNNLSISYNENSIETNFSDKEELLSFNMNYRDDMRDTIDEIDEIEDIQNCTMDFKDEIIREKYDTIIKQIIQYMESQTRMSFTVEDELLEILCDKTDLFEKYVEQISYLNEKIKNIKISQL